MQLILGNYPQCLPPQSVHPAMPKLLPTLLHHAPTLWTSINHSHDVTARLRPMRNVLIYRRPADGCLLTATPFSTVYIPASGFSASSLPSWPSLSRPQTVFLQSTGLLCLLGWDQVLHSSCQGSHCGLIAHWRTIQAVGEGVGGQQILNRVWPTVQHSTVLCTQPPADRPIGLVYSHVFLTIYLHQTDEYIQFISRYKIY